jgi:hypothetical protein
MSGRWIGEATGLGCARCEVDGTFLTLEVEVAFLGYTWRVIDAQHEREAVLKSGFANTVAAAKKAASDAAKGL